MVGFWILVAGFAGLLGWALVDMLRDQGGEPVSATEGRGVTVDIREFLQQCLAEDELLARCAMRTATGPLRRSEPPHLSGRGTSAKPDGHAGGAVEDETGGIVVYDEGLPTPAQAEHIARHDPARVLRDVAATRLLLVLHELTVRRVDAPPFDPFTGEKNPIEHTVECAVCGWASSDPTSACETVRLLALAYDQHPDYRSEWAP